MQEIQDVEKFLYHYGDVVRQYNNQEEHIKELFAKKYEAMDSLLRVPVSDNTPVQNGKNDDPVYKVVQKLVDVYDEQITKATERLREIGFELEEMRCKIASAGLRENELKFVELRYVEGLKIKEIADRISYSERQCRSYKARIVIRIKEVDKSERRIKKTN